ncbi:uncharacterized protein LOC125423741 [Ziziphus jujuba]|uniref:Uncharacterized protein LOC125423741 n=1 Tax=Ziziphus jujuba TaxID=326968 RepID=A0ABM3ISX2_ZIZJJ|nr:uncharacterized protein LOC125423741 [Ziziphus jujuba]
MAELLCRMLHKWESDNKFHGVKFGRFSPPISHLMFADDFILFFLANSEEVKNVQHCLQLYGKWTGQAFNMDKYGVLFSHNVTGSTKSNIKSYLGTKELNKKTKHLGLPLFIEKNKNTSLEELRKQIKFPFQGWKAKILSKTGCATLIKHVITSISVYAMSSFFLQEGWCENLEKMA